MIQMLKLIYKNDEIIVGRGSIKLITSITTDDTINYAVLKFFECYKQVDGNVTIAYNNHFHAIDSSYVSDENVFAHNNLSLSLSHLRHCIPFTTESPSSSSAQHRPSRSQTHPTMSLSNPHKWVFPKRFPHHQAHLCIRHIWRVHHVKVRL